MMSLIIGMLVFGGIGTVISWIVFFNPECSEHGIFRYECDRCIESKRKKFLFACRATLYFPIWPLALGVFCFNRVRSESKKIEEKKPHLYICPECERKFLE